MPFAPQDKNAGDVLRSQDWNAGMQEILRLNRDKVDRKGDTITGPLSIGDKLTVLGNSEFKGPLAVKENYYLSVKGEAVAGTLRVGAAWGMPGLYSGDSTEAGLSKDLILGAPKRNKVYLGFSKEDAYLESGTGNAYLRGSLGLGTNSPVEKLEVMGNIKAQGTLYAGGNPVTYENYEIYLRGSAFESSEGNITFLKIANISININNDRGINTTILNPNGTYKHRDGHDVYASQGNWNTWADWVIANSSRGDIIAVASFDALSNAPRAGSAETLLNSIGAVEAFRVQIGNQNRIPYALLFIRGQAGAVEISQPYRGANAHIRTTYYSLLNAANTVITGMIVMWSGDEASIPGGWALCDGQAGRPDLRGRFVLGSGQGPGLSNRAKGLTGGTERHTLTVAEMPSHSHGVNDPTHGHTWSASRQEAGTDDRNSTIELSKGDRGDVDTIVKTTTSVATGISIANNGSGSSHENMPPFYVLAFIIKL